MPFPQAWIGEKPLDHELNQCLWARSEDISGLGCGLELVSLGIEALRPRNPWGMPGWAHSCSPQSP